MLSVRFAMNMTIEFVPLLQIQRDLYELPRGRERFEAYLRTMIDPRTGDLSLPLVPMNPMGREHVPALLDSYIACTADEKAEQAVAAVSGRYAEVAATFRVGLVIADDLKGGWTNRFAAEFGHRVETRAFHRRGWLLGILWTSEAPRVELAVDEALMAVHRGAYIERHGYACTLGHMLAQEGFAAAAAGCTAPALETDDLLYTREALTPLLEASDRPTVFAALFGDAAARQLGYRPLGLSDRAGLALALHQAREAMPHE